jgi:hypothetical protein
MRPLFFVDRKLVVFFLCFTSRDPPPIKLMYIFFIFIIYVQYLDSYLHPSKQSTKENYCTRLLFLCGGEKKNNFKYFSDLLIFLGHQSTVYFLSIFTYT